MPDHRDPRALVRHAAEAGDLRLLELVASRLRIRPPPWLGPRRSAYATLVGVLGLDGSAADADHERSC